MVTTQKAITIEPREIKINTETENPGSECGANQTCSGGVCLSKNWQPECAVHEDCRALAENAICDPIPIIVSNNPLASFISKGNTSRQMKKKRYPCSIRASMVRFFLPAPLNPKATWSKHASFTCNVQDMNRPPIRIYLRIAWKQAAN
ncbi:MAG: hypothetical protein J6A01_00430 [Proteobacteria bacterium]|nr:hypothetical protein [Pseudomonadota bacterium]